MYLYFLTAVPNSCCWPLDGIFAPCSHTPHCLLSTRSDDHKHSAGHSRTTKLLRCPLVLTPRGEHPPARENMQKVPQRSSTAAVPTHEGVAPDRVEHLDEGEGPHRDVTGALHLEARFLVEGDQEVFTHEHSAADVGQAAEVLQIAPHQDGAFALLAKGPVDG